MSKVLSVSIVLLLLVTAASGDWDPGDGHKMHYPQMPDPFGWDVDVTTGFVADDWQCSQTGPVDDIHFWISAKGDNWGNGIDFIEVRIYDDIPANTGTDPLPFSRPGEEKWFSRVEDLAAGGDVFTLRLPALTGQQGWYTPMAIPPVVINPDHNLFGQVNIQDIVNPFQQTQGEIYWLEIHIIPNNVDSGQVPPLFGWKTSLDHWNDDAVYEDTNFNWQELRDPFNPQTGESLDMAFVITPEPATLGLLLLGGLALLRRRR